MANNIPDDNKSRMPSVKIAIETNAKEIGSSSVSL